MCFICVIYINQEDGLEVTRLASLVLDQDKEAGNMAITSQEFRGLARGKMKSKMKMQAPSVKVPKRKSNKIKLDPPPDYPQRRSGLGGAGI